MKITALLKRFGVLKENYKQGIGEGGKDALQYEYPEHRMKLMFS